MSVADNAQLNVVRSSIHIISTRPLVQLVSSQRRCRLRSRSATHLILDAAAVVATRWPTVPRLGAATIEFTSTQRSVADRARAPTDLACQYLSAAHAPNRVSAAR